MARLPNMQIQRWIPAAPTRWRSLPAEAPNNTGMDDFIRYQELQKKCGQLVKQNPVIAAVWGQSWSCVLGSRVSVIAEFKLVGVNESRWMKGQAHGLKTHC